MFPAHAGMTRLEICHRIDVMDVPRPRGDDPAQVEDLMTKEVCSPPTRG